MVDLLEETRQELERERWLNIWKRIGSYVVALSVAIVLVTVGMVWWQNHQKSQQEAAALAYSIAMEQAESGSWDAAAQAYGEAAETNVAGVAPAAEIQQAQALWQAGETDAARDKLQAVVNDGGVDAPWDTLAALRLAVLLIDTDAPLAEVSTLLEPLTKDQNQFGYFHAHELLGYAALGQGEEAVARDYFDVLISNPLAPAGMRQRARTAATTLPPVTEQPDAAS